MNLHSTTKNFQNQKGLSPPYGGLNKSPRFPMAHGCQVIKSNDKWCRNYARKGMTCCWVHRNFENSVVEMEPTKESGIIIMQDILTGDLFMKFKQPEDGREWPTLDEVHSIIESQNVNTYGSLLMFQKIWLSVAESENWSKYERRMLALIFTEFHFKLVKNGLEFKQSLFDTVLGKLQESGYDPIYMKFASELKSI